MEAKLCLLFFFFVYVCGFRWKTWEREKGLCAKNDKGKSKVNNMVKKGEDERVSGGRVGHRIKK